MVYAGHSRGRAQPRSGRGLWMPRLMATIVQPVAAAIREIGFESAPSEGWASTSRVCGIRGSDSLGFRH